MPVPREPLCKILPATHLSVAVLGLDIVGKGLGLLELLVVVVVVVVVLGAGVLHLVHAAALGAALDRAVAGHLVTISQHEQAGKRGKTHAEPGSVVGVGGDTRAAGKLLLTSRADGDGVLHGAQAASVEGAQVEDVDAIHLAENLETLQTGGLLEVRGDRARFGTGAEEVFLALDLCCKLPLA